MNRLQEERLVNAVRNSRPVTGLSHTFYKYPARFSPIFSREVIALFTNPGDVIFDPFMGGGTSLVEALALGRSAIGLDINPLAVFVTGVKTTTLTLTELARASRLVERLSRIALAGANQDKHASLKYTLNMNNRETWRIRNFISLCLHHIDQKAGGGEGDFVRCIVLRTGQWALDCKRATPSLEAFRCQLLKYGAEAIAGGKELTKKLLEIGGKRARRLVLMRSAIGCHKDERVKRFGAPSLVLTSPPYPGVHVLYHRWQIQGRRETAAPYWIANLPDGHGASYYTFADRGRAEITKYLEIAEMAFGSVRKIVKKGTPMVQMVAFNDPETQLRPYLEMLHSAGWRELSGPGKDRHRLRRTVPGRKWYSTVARSRASRELVLLHEAT